MSNERPFVSLAFRKFSFIATLAVFSMTGATLSSTLAKGFNPDDENSANSAAIAAGKSAESERVYRCKYRIPATPGRIRCRFVDPNQTAKNAAEKVPQHRPCRRCGGRSY